MIGDFTSWEDTLVHHGIKGQKWGVRRFQNADGSLTKRGISRYRNPSKMTDDELRQGIKRAELEKKYRELTKPSSKLVNLVKSFVDAKKAYAELETERLKVQTQKAEAMAKYARAKADVKIARSNAKKAKFEMQTYSTKAKNNEEIAAKYQARIGLKKTKEEIGSKTISGALRRKVAGLILNGKDKKDKGASGGKDKKK